MKLKTEIIAQLARSQQELWSQQQQSTHNNITVTLQRMMRYSLLFYCDIHDFICDVLSFCELSFMFYHTVQTHFA